VIKLFVVNVMLNLDMIIIMWKKLIETLQEFYGPKRRTRITTHEGYRLIEHAYPNGDYDKNEKFYKSHSEDCLCLKEKDSKGYPC